MIKEIEEVVEDYLKNNLSIEAVVYHGKIRIAIYLGSYSVCNTHISGWEIDSILPVE